MKINKASDIEKLTANQLNLINFSKIDELKQTSAILRKAVNQRIRRIRNVKTLNIVTVEDGKTVKKNINVDVSQNPFLRSIDNEIFKAPKKSDYKNIDDYKRALQQQVRDLSNIFKKSKTSKIKGWQQSVNQVVEKLNITNQAYKSSQFWETYKKVLERGGFGYLDSTRLINDVFQIYYNRDENGNKRTKENSIRPKDFKKDNIDTIIDLVAELEGVNRYEETSPIDEINEKLPRKELGGFKM